MSLPSALWAFEGHKYSVDAKMPVRLDLATNFAKAFKDGLDLAGGRKVSQDWWADVLDAVGTDPFLSAKFPGWPFGGFPPRQAITFMKGWLDYKSGKSDTAWSLIDRGARFHDEAPGARGHGRKCQIWCSPISPRLTLTILTSMAWRAFTSFGTGARMQPL